MPPVFQTKLVDTHAHLCDALFDDDRAEVLERAKKVGVGLIVAVSEDLADAEKTLEMARSHCILRAAAGLYPARLGRGQMRAMVEFIREQRSSLAAIGEVGLDYWIAKGEKERGLQREIFKRFVRLSMELDLPLNVHSRSAGKTVVELLLDIGAERVQLHAFDGKVGAALPAAEAGYFFSIPPSVVRSRQKQKLVKQLPLSSLLVESDSPVLGPVPHQRNEPANVLFSVNAIAEIKGRDREEVVEAVCENTFRLYGDLSHGS